MKPETPPDVGRRVLQCPCFRPLLWRDEETAREQGWRRVWGPDAAGKLCARWVCADCYRAPAPPPPARGLPTYLETLLVTDHPLAREQLDLMRANEPDRFEECLGIIEGQTAPKLTSALRRTWLTYVRRARPERRAA